MFVDTQETSFLHDLSKPGLNALSHILRHRELWPKEFRWNYTDCDTCAVGLARELWRLSNDLDMEKVFDIPSFAAENIFFAFNDWYEDLGVKFSAVTPEMVADQIDKYIASR